MKFTLTDRLMWHFMQGTCYKVLRAEYPKWDFHQLRKAAKERFSDILTSTPSIGSYRENSLKKNLVGGMVWFAIYETAKERPDVTSSVREDVPCIHRHAHDAQNGTNDEAVHKEIPGKHDETFRTGEPHRLSLQLAGSLQTGKG